MAICWAECVLRSKDYSLAFASKFHVNLVPYFVLESKDYSLAMAAKSMSILWIIFH